MKKYLGDEVASKTFVKYILVGLGAVLIDITLYYILISSASLSPSLAKKISFAVGAGWSYFFNKQFTFEIKNFSWRMPVYFLVIYVAGFFLNSMVHDIVFRLSNLKYVAIIIATGCSVIWNYVGQKNFVFKK